MPKPVTLSDKIIEGIKYILSQAREFSRPIQHEIIQQELFTFFRENGFDAFFEYELEYYHIYRGTKNTGKIKLIENGRIDIYAKKDNIEVAVEFDSGATLKWKSIEKLLQCDAQYCFGIVSGAKSNKTLILNMYDEKNLWKCQLTLQEQILMYDDKKEFNNLYNLLNKQIWIGNVKRNTYVFVSPKEIISSKISLKNLMIDTDELFKRIPYEKKKISEHKKTNDKSVIVFKLENDKWYVGRTNNLEGFIENIKNGNGPPWTQINKFISVYEIIEKGDPKTITLDYMKKFGWQNVRGYAWSQVNMKRPPITLRVGDLRDAVSLEKFNEIVYILKLEQNKWFLGKCLDQYLTRRINKQKNGLGNEWTKTYKVIEVEKLVQNGDLKALTLDYMKKYGWQNVRGHSWTQKKMKKPPKELGNL